jgi:hypothetical protein
MVLRAVAHRCVSTLLEIQLGAVVDALSCVKFDVSTLLEIQPGGLVLAPLGHVYEGFNPS